MEVTKIKYRCTTCDAVDFYKTFPDESHPQVINCWSCEAGRKMQTQEMMMSGKGMFVAIDQEKGEEDEELQQDCGSVGKDQSTA